MFFKNKMPENKVYTPEDLFIIVLGQEIIVLEEIEIILLYKSSRVL